VHHTLVGDDQPLVGGTDWRACVLASGRAASSRSGVAERATADDIAQT